MKREIKYRAWDKEGKRFYYFYNGRYYNDGKFEFASSGAICLGFDWDNAVEIFTKKSNYWRPQNEHL